MCGLKHEHSASDVYSNTHSMKSMHVISPTVCMQGYIQVWSLQWEHYLCSLLCKKKDFFVCRPEFSQVNVKEDNAAKLYNINHAQLLNLDLITTKQYLKFTSAFM